MKSNAKKSIMDFKGQAMPIGQQKVLTGGDGNQNPVNDGTNFIITQDVVDG